MNVIACGRGSMTSEESSKHVTIIDDKALKKNNILLFLENRTDEYLDRIALAMKTQYGWKEFTYKGLGYMSRRLATYFINNLQVQRGDKVAILSESMP